MLRSAVRSLQGDRAIGQRGSDLDDGSTIARIHALECRHRSIDGSQIGDLGGALEFRRGDVSEWGEHGCHGVVHPDIDWTELALDGIGSLLNLLTLSHIRGNRQRAASAVVYIRNRAVQSILSSRQQADTRPTLG